MHASPDKPDQEPPRTQFGLKSLFLLTTAVGLYCLTIGRMPLAWHAMFISSVVGLLNAIPCVEYGRLRGLMLYRAWGWFLFCGSFLLLAFAIGWLLLAAALWCYARMWFGTGPTLGP